ncbi:MAG: glycosyltransferase family 87 protein [Terriglobia bacterium]
MRRVIAVSLLLAVAAGAVCALRPLKAVDLHVYHTAAVSYFLQSGPMYGPNHEFGWPMLYRYPPLFLCLFRPFASLPLSVAAGMWAALKVLFLGPLAVMWYRRYPPSRLGPALGISALLLLPYLLYELQVGNVQLFLVEMVCLALLLCDEHPIASSLLLGLATAIKVWPAFILPFLAARGRWRVGVQAFAATGAFTVLPGFWLGWTNLFHLLKQWFLQEQRINALLGDRWYPSQSLRGVMLRYLTRMDYSGLPDQNYRPVNFVSLPAWEVREFWLVLAIVLGVLALLWVFRCASDVAAHSMFFCSLLIIEPNAQRIAYVTLLWPSLYAGIVLTDQKTLRLARWVLLGAAAVAVLEPLVPGAASQRLAQVLGIDFLGVLVPLAIVHLACSSRGISSPLHCPASGTSSGVRHEKTHHDSSVVARGAGLGIGAEREPLISRSRLFLLWPWYSNRRLH